jgi:hypothetical protein
VRCHWAVNERLEGDDSKLIVWAGELYTDTSFCHHRKLGTRQNLYTNTPKALANFSPELEGWYIHLMDQPRVVAFRSNPGLKLANAFGVFV